MALINDVKQILLRLWNEPNSDWSGLFQKHGWTITASQLNSISAANLNAALVGQALSVNRGVPGFKDFGPSGSQLVTAGSPAKSLLYHAFASPAVHPTANGLPSTNSKAYCDLQELDVIENYIYSLAAGRTDLQDTFIAVFAYQYRSGSRSPHRRFADMAYSRTGVARVGTTGANYERGRRSFWVIPAVGGDEIAVMPARYAAFLARRAKPGAAGSVQGGHQGANDVDFIFPIHKLFDGNECLSGKSLKVRFAEFHRNEKLRKVHSLPTTDGGLPVPAGFDITKSPYVRDSSNGGNLVSLEPAGSSVLVVPTPGKSLVRTVTQTNSVTGTQQLVHFIVPAETIIRSRDTRFAQSTLEIPAFGGDRLAPEYVNVRHQIVPSGPVTQRPVDLSQTPVATPDPFQQMMRNGNYAAAHYVDDSCDGCVEAVVSGIAATPEDRPAFSLVTAPDFFPLADQIELAQDSSIEDTQPLSGGRLPADPTLPLPSNPTVMAFRHRDKGTTAVVGASVVGPVLSVLGTPNEMTSFLPDAASNVFAPGWDTSRSRDAVGTFLTSSGLGSPFPEDAKLCAALSSFWPAVAPDASRTFGNSFPNQLPMLDDELGLHPNHDRVRIGGAGSFRGWDGEFGPFFEKVSSRVHVNFANFARSDYVSNALAGTIRVSLTANVQSEDLLARAQALQACQRMFQSFSNVSADCLVVAVRVADWATAGRGVPQLTGAGFLYEFAKFSGPVKQTNDVNRLRRPVAERYICQIGSNGIAFKNGAQAFQFVPF